MILPEGPWLTSKEQPYFLSGDRTASLKGFGIEVKTTYIPGDVAGERMYKFFVAMILISAGPCALAQSCSLSGARSWNPALRNIVAGCPDKFVSPDGRFILQVSSEGQASLLAKSEPKPRWNGVKFEPPAMISWSPDSSAFFLNDGDGSGMSSSFRLFRLLENRILEDASIEHAVVARYRSRTRCSSSMADPNVWGFGWNAHGDKILLLVQPTVNEPCGRPEDFISLIVRTSDGAVVETLSKKQTKAQFGALLPSTMLLDDRCCREESIGNEEVRGR
jgi:hypothetical protein